jgi:hypothetical protein
MPLRLPGFVLIGLSLAGCTTAPDGSTSVSVTAGAVNYHIPGPSRCAAPISDFQSVIENDVTTGHLAKGVHGRITADLEPVKAACNAGREADATRQLAAVKARYGYR